MKIKALALTALVLGYQYANCGTYANIMSTTGAIGAADAADAAKRAYCAEEAFHNGFDPADQFIFNFDRQTGSGTFLEVQACYDNGCGKLNEFGFKVDVRPNSASGTLAFHLDGLQVGCDMMNPRFVGYRIVKTQKVGRKLSLVGSADISVEHLKSKQSLNFEKAGYGLSLDYQAFVRSTQFPASPAAGSATR